MRSLLWKAPLVAVLALVGYLADISIRIGRQSIRDEARPADAILVLGAAEYRGRPSPVLKARLDHALDLYQRKMAPVLITTGGAGGVNGNSMVKVVPAGLDSTLTVPPIRST